jgi:CRP-like cAMP-binding protein
VETIQPAQIAFVAADEFVAFLKRNDDVLLRVTQYLSYAYESAIDALRSFTLSPSARLARILLELSLSGTSRRSHEELAEAAGRTRETATRILGDFRRRGLVAPGRGSFLIKDRQAIENVAGGYGHRCW